MEQLLIKGGQIFDGEALYTADLLIADGVIAGIGEGLAAPGARLMQAEGCVVSPGFTDLHVHLRQPGFEEKETIASGTKAAAAGGFTTVCAMPNLNPVPDSLESLRPQLQAIEEQALVRVLPYGAITRGERGGTLSDIEALAPHVCGFTDDGRGVQSQEMMRRAMELCAKNGRIIAAHCEVESLLPPGAVCVQEGSAFANAHGWVGYSDESEWSEVERNIRLAEETGCALHICHTSSQKSYQLVLQAKEKGLPVTCEATPHNLLLSCDDISEDSGRFRMNPPLRAKDAVLMAQKSLLQGGIDAIATDHAPHTDAEKLVPFGQSLNGVVGLETCFAACYTGLVQKGLLPLAQLLQMLAVKPRAILGEAFAPLATGQRADLTVVDLQSERTVDPASFFSKGKATPFAGQVLAGWPALTLYNGAVVYERGQN